MNQLKNLIIIFSLLFLVSCGQRGGNKPTENEKDNNSENNESKTGIKKLDDFVDNMKEVQKKMEDKKEVKAVDFRKLKELLPEQIMDLNRENAQGQKTNTMGFEVSQSEAEYKGNADNDNRRIKIKISDFGGVQGFYGMAAFAWALTDIDKESDNGYEKTSKINGHKAYEKYTYSSQTGEVSVFVADRYLVEVDGSGVPMEVIKKALDEINISQLAAMKDAGVVNQ